MGSRETKVYALVAGLLILLNFSTLLLAYPTTMEINSGCCAPADKLLQKDFSAFYSGAWRLIHDPTQIYTPGAVQDGEPFSSPPPEQFKYLPSFLLLVTPSLLLPYQEALSAFDVFQFLLLPVLAYIIYRLTRARGLPISILLAVAVLLLPSPTANWGPSASYYWQWAEGQSKVLETFLLMLSFYLGNRGNHKLSGGIFGLSAFDPRFALVALPLFLTYNRLNLRGALGFAVGHPRGHESAPSLPWSGLWVRPDDSRRRGGDSPLLLLLDTSPLNRGPDGH